LAGRLQVVGLQHLPSWGVFLEPSYATDGRVDMGRIGDELVGTVPAGVEALILECTILPQLRPLLRTVTDVPLFDAMTYTAAVAA
jgi:hypothetical protein